MTNECVILADSPSALTELCGISVLERLLRTVQRCGIEHAIVLSSIADVADELARPSWPRAQLKVTIRARAPGPVTLDQILEIWPKNSEVTPLLLVLPADSVFDARLLRLLIVQESPAALVDSGVRRRQLQALIASVPDTTCGKLCGAAVLTYDWAVAQNSVFDQALRNGLERHTLAAVDVSSQSLYYVSMRRKLSPFWFPAPSPANTKFAQRVLFDSIQKGTLDIPAWFHVPIETFLVSRLCKTPITPNQLTLFCNLVAWVVTFLFATGRLGWGLALALVVGVLDGLDGKQARLKVETTQTGRIEHWFDAVFEMSWWIALAWHFQMSGRLHNAFAYLVLLLVAEGVDGLAKASVYFTTGKIIDELGAFERFVRLVGGRRNVYVWILTIGFLFDAPAKAFITMAWLQVVTAIVHLPSAIGNFIRNRHLFSVRLRD